MLSDLVAMFLLGYYMCATSYSGKASVNSVPFWAGVILILLSVIGYSVGHFTARG